MLFLKEKNEDIFVKMMSKNGWMLDFSNSFFKKSFNQITHDKKRRLRRLRGAGPKIGRRPKGTYIIRNGSNDSRGSRVLRCSKMKIMKFGKFNDKKDEIHLEVHH